MKIIKNNLYNKNSLIKYLLVYLCVCNMKI